MTHRKPWSIAILIATLAVAGALTAPCTALAQSGPVAEIGKAVYKRANCVGCHKWHGNGGGGYGGDALSLRKTELTREQIAETVGCGRPGKGMPVPGRPQVTVLTICSRSSCVLRSDKAAPP